MNDADHCDIVSFIPVQAENLTLIYSYIEEDISNISFHYVAYL